MEKLAIIEQQTRDLELLQRLIDTTTRAGHLAGPLALEVSGMRELLRRAREQRGFEGVLLIMRIMRSAIEVCRYFFSCCCVQI